MKRPDLHRLSKPFPPQFVAKKEGADYVNHAIVQQRLLGTVGPFDMRVDQVIRGPIAEKVTGKGDRQRTWPAADNAVVGVVLTCTFTIDGERVEVSEIGTPEGYYMAAHDGERLKKAMSDALKRCAMRVGVGLDLWSKGAYVLPAMLGKDLDTETGEVTEDPEADAPEPDHDAPDPDEVDTVAADDETVDLAPLEAVITEAREAGVDGDFEAMRAYAAQTPENVGKAVAKLRAAIDKKASQDTHEGGQATTETDPEGDAAAEGGDGPSGHDAGRDAPEPASRDTDDGQPPADKGGTNGREVDDGPGSGKPTTSGDDAEGGASSPDTPAWRLQAEAEGISDQQLLIGLQKAWPNNDQASKPTRTANLDAVADRHEGLYASVIERLAQDARQGASA